MNDALLEGDRWQMLERGEVRVDAGIQMKWEGRKDPSLTQEGRKKGYDAYVLSYRRECR